MSSERKPSEDELVAELMRILRPMARYARAKKGRSATFDTSDLVNEAAAKVLESSRAYITAPLLKLLGGRAIRQVLFDQARTKHLKKAIPAALIDSLDSPVSDEAPGAPATQRGLKVDSDIDQVLWLEQILQRIEEKFGKKAVLITVGRRYSGMTDEELAQALGVSIRTVERTRRRVISFCRREFVRRG